MKTNSSIEKFAQMPYLWDTFESIFGANKAKQKLYRSKFRKPVRLMDFGCATGNTTTAFLDFDYVGIDIDKPSINWAKKKWINYSNVKFISKNILDDKIKVDKFDAILFASTGHHLDTQTLLLILRKLSTFLNKKGKIYYFDTLKPGKSSHFITKWLCSIDRGAYMRRRKDFMEIFNSLSDVYTVKEIRTEKVSDTLLPQPKYIFALLCVKQRQ